MKLEEIQGLTEEQLADIQKVIQSAEDKVRTDKTQRIKELEAELQQYKPIEKTEAEKQLEARIAELEQREHSIKTQEREAQLQSKLKEKGLDIQLLKYLNVGEDADTFLDEFSTVINNQLLETSYKPQVHKGESSAVTKEQFKAMGYCERVKLQESNPALYDILTQA